MRLGFHDCASAKCDACVDPKDPNNPGLGAMVTTLAPVCAKYAAQMSAADCWAAAATMAAEELSSNGATVMQMPLFFGRADAPACTGFTADSPEAILPNATFGTQRLWTISLRHPL